MQIIPLAYARVMMLQDLDPILQLHQLILRESLDLPRFQHLEALIVLSKYYTLLRLMVLEEGIIVLSSSEG